MAGMFGIYRGILVDAIDPMGASRVRVSLPSISMGGGPVWARICVPMGQVQRVPPQPGVEVWVMFEAGQIDNPVVMGLTGT